MDFHLTAAEDTLVHHIAARLRPPGVSPAPTPPGPRLPGSPPTGNAVTDDDLADELGDDVRPLLQSLLYKGWLVVHPDRTLTLSPIARAVVSDDPGAGGGATG